MRIETDHRNPKERQPGTLSRWEYTEVDALKVENEEAEVTPCGASKPAIVVYGEGAGTTRTICIDPECPIHHPSRVVPVDPDAEARRKQHEKEQGRRRRLEKDRAETFSRILENAPATFTAPQLRALLRAFITCDLYGQSNVVATHYAGEDDDNNQSSEEILLSVADRLEEVQLPELALRLALCSHIRIPNENEIDHLAEVEKVFAHEQAKKLAAKKKNVKKPAPTKGKTAKKKATKRTAA
ncbi:MAG: ParB family transcriptional regulator, chromosome partitioning protein [Acidobacteriaceae bacterium]|nr:ParB family transcriptional regulator, chromosome partitioning protein [Acidobacteriaceae bacterium]